MKGIWISKLFLIIVTLLFHSELGCGLECFICHSRQEKNCSDPFPGDKTEVVDCKRVRNVGLGVIAAESALGATLGQYSVLAYPPHVCYKLAFGQYLIRGCGKPDICHNYTETECGTCDSNGCNGSSFQKPLNAVILIFLNIYSYL